MDHNVVTISWKRPRATANGMAVPEGSAIARMRPRRRRKASDADMVALLDDALKDLAGVPCAFFACEGPNRPRHMCTCTKCWAMRSIGTVRATLAARSVMDPSVCVLRVVRALPGDVVGFLEACTDLADWLSSGGFTPSNIARVTDEMLLMLKLHGYERHREIIEAARAKVAG